MWKNSPKLTKRHPKKFGTLVTVFISSDYPMFAKICPTMFSVWGSRKKNLEKFHFWPQIFHFWSQICQFWHKICNFRSEIAIFGNLSAIFDQINKWSIVWGSQKNISKNFFRQIKIFEISFLYDHVGNSGKFLNFWFS